MLHRSILMSAPALAAALLLIAGCDTDQGPATPEDRTVTQSPDPQQPEDARQQPQQPQQPQQQQQQDVRDGRGPDTGADGIDVDRQRSPGTPQTQDDASEGIEVEPER